MTDGDRVRQGEQITHSRTCDECGDETYQFERCHVCGDVPWEIVTDGGREQGSMLGSVVFTTPCPKGQFWELCNCLSIIVCINDWTGGTVVEALTISRPRVGGIEHTDNIVRYKVSFRPT